MCISRGYLPSGKWTKFPIHTPNPPKPRNLTITMQNQGTRIDMVEENYESEGDDSMTRRWNWGIQTNIYGDPPP